MTIKPPFEADEGRIADIERILRAFTSSEVAAPLVFRGFGRFGFRTVYIDVRKSPDAVSFVRRALKTLNDNATWLPHNPLEGNKLHVSVARFLSRQQSRRIWRFLRECSYPHFESRFDNIAILKKDGRAWRIHTLIPLHIPDERLGYAFHFEPEKVLEEKMLVP